ncbi:hypothetical protein VHUM_01672 [Vanrija humicola]|uniref:Thioredoxin domain-containing protein n=1 Tax=Vanrija humicola TaxID=5417 RepID=A0A7D8Z409_VANHU|nr:hypothetical protein VHUM_01672 [Vanrija humicola]
MASLLRSARVASTSRLVAARSLHSSAVRRDHFLDVDPAAFKARALDEKLSKPVLVDFYADWCQPCRVLQPLLKGLTAPGSDFDLITIDVDKFPEVAGEYKVTALPTVVAFKDGKVKNKFSELRLGALLTYPVGFRPEAELKKFLDML